MRIMCFLALSLSFGEGGHSLQVLAGTHTCWLQELPNVLQAEQVRLQVGAFSINRVLIKVAAPLSESEAPRQKALGYSGSRLTLFHLQWNKT